MDTSRKMTGRKIAIVEDDLLLREALTIFLKAKGCQVKSFETAEDAAREGNLAGYDAVISDYLLPAENGISFLRRVREASSSAVTVLITAYPKEELEEAARLAGIDAFIPKPFTAEKLAGELQQLIDRRKADGDGLTEAGV